MASVQTDFRIVVENVMNRWTALRMAVEHGMGGPLGLNTAIELIDYVTSYCTENKNVDSFDLREILEEIMDQEYETICEDDSIQEISVLLVTYLNLLKQGKGDEVRAQLGLMKPCEMWIVSGAKIKYQRMDDSSDSENDDDDREERMEVEQTTTNGNVEVIGPSTEGSSTKFIEETIDPGWTQVRGRRRR
ncbi:uncharacterized protein LOC128271267 [Anopheles cruzii]|uniref:uncharacterized protein LOC128271267 n=1 Tax=Anopheles cruzii TaxID=68878 RepID=UPI0022EC2DFB|nr:uncharacterized protein LOC128271267 [Anopheles cruzii]